EVVGIEVGSGRDLLVGHDHAVDVAAPCPIYISPTRVQMQANLVSRIRPLWPQHDCRSHDNDLLGRRCPSGSTRSARLPGTQRRHEKKITAPAGRVLSQEVALPRAEPDRD